MLWVDLAAPSIPESLILSDTFAFHPLSVEDAMAPMQYPEGRGLRRLPVRHPPRHRLPRRGATWFATHDVDFFLGPNYLVTVHDGTSRSIAELRDHCPRNPKILGEGPGRAVPSHRRRDGRPLPAGGRGAGGSARRAREAGVSTSPAADAGARDPRREAGRVVAAAHRHRRSATSSAGWRGASSPTSAPRCRSGSATSTTTSSASPTTR